MLISTLTQYVMGADPATLPLTIMAGGAVSVSGNVREGSFQARGVQYNSNMYIYTILIYIHNIQQ